MIVDPSLNLLQYKLGILDDVLNRLDDEAMTSPDPDSCGIYDTVDDISGFGFVACQKYIQATFGRLKIKRNDALALGPRHETGQSLVRLICECANYWKHCDEWQPERLDGRQQKTRELMETLGIEVFREFQMANALYELTRPRPPRMASLLPLLIQWRDEVLDTQV